MKTILNWFKQYVGSHQLRRPVTLTITAVILFLLLPEARTADLQTENVFLIVSDGLRWQEVFTGAEELLLSKEIGGVKNTNSFRADFWRETPEARRQSLLPFFWSEIARHGQLFGNQRKGSVVTVTNGKKFSYPGYNEIFTGFGDPRIDSNDKKLNPNVNVFEWLQTKPRFRRNVVVFGSWDLFPYIVNRPRSVLPVWPAWEARFEDKTFSPPKLLATLISETTPIWEDLIPDSFLFEAAIDHVKRKRPRLMFLGFGETDEWAHSGRYDVCLYAAKNFDRFVKMLWDTVQSMPRYRDKTTFLITADHGRGSGPTEWKDHGEKIHGSEGIWMAAIGPDTPPLGERTNLPPLTQSQIAATVAALLGEDYRADFPKAGAAIADIVVGRPAKKPPGKSP